MMSEYLVRKLRSR